MLDSPLLPQPAIPDYSKPQENIPQEEQKNSTGGELQEIIVDKVRRIIIRGQIDGS